MRHSLRPFLTGAILCAALGACETAPVGAPHDAGASSSPARAARPVPDTWVPTSAQSRQLATRLTQLEGKLRTLGLMRTDGGLTDAAFTADELARNFALIALQDEYTSVGGRLLPSNASSTLRRWEKPVRLYMSFGASVPIEVRNRDSAIVRRYAARLSQVTGHPVSMARTRAQANFHILLLSYDELRALPKTAAAFGLRQDPSLLRSMADLNTNTYCANFGLLGGESGSVYETAVTVVRMENPDLMRRACYHEELAQGMGLVADAAIPVPSIFTDNEEFALLTGHDELLLRMLYDTRLSPGMTPDQARPIVAQIAQEMVAGQS